MAWSVAIAVGGFALWSYSRQAGAVGAQPERWPEASRIVRGERPILLLFVHPRCPCSAASLTELAETMAAAPGAVDAHVLFWTPKDAGASWHETPLVRQAREIPGLQIAWDEGGREAARFGALTSGHAACFDKDGERIFAGGITLARGHAGRNAGRTAILAGLAGGPPSIGEHCVYGCGLTSPASSN